MRHKPTHAFVLHLIPEPGVDEIKALRTLLKFAGRRLGLRCVDVRECALTHGIDERALALTGRTQMSAFSDKIRGGKKGFFKVADLEGGKERTLTISHLDEDMEVFGRTVDLLNFVETGQQLQLNQTNAEWLLDHLGEDPTTWKGKRVVLYLAPYTYEGETKQGIRLKLPGAAKPQPPTRSNPPTRSSAPKGNGDRRSDLDDEIPF
jgi:hypothetical protein